MNKYINLNRLEYLVTYHCSAECIHCYARPKQKEYSKHIAPDLAVQVLREVGQRYHLESVMTFGGEPLLYPEVVYAIHNEARNVGIPQRQVITNGYWSKNDQKIREIARFLADSGVNEVCISVDTFHQEHVPLEIVKHAAKALLDAGIQDIVWNPSWLVAEENNNVYNQKTRVILDELKALPIRVGGSNVVEPEGKALENLRDYFHPAFQWERTSCQDIPYMNKLDDIQSICVEPNGDIPLCHSFLLGNVLQQTVCDIFEQYNPYDDPDMKLIIEKGMDGFTNRARSLGIELQEQGYYSICDLCTSLRGHPKWRN